MTEKPDKMHPLTLRFADADFERRFLDYYMRDSIKFLRACCILVVLVFTIGTGFAVEQIGVPSVGSYDVIRYKIVPAVYLLFLAITFSPLFNARTFQWWTAFGIFALEVVLLSSGSVLFPEGQENPMGLSRAMAIQVFGFPIFAAVAMAVYTLVRLRFVHALITGTAASAMALIFLWRTGTPFNVYLFDVGTFIWTAIPGAMGAYYVEMVVRKGFSADQALKIANDKAEVLLLNIIPATIADRLKEDNSSIAEGFHEVAVLFADVAGFTPMSLRMPPEQVVGLLNGIFSAFDGLAEKHKLEKIKTIGDAYMVAAGIPEPRADYVDAIADMGLEMLKTIEQFRSPDGETVELRIGINEGPVVAGVIGIKRWIYDLWGDTVNTASRMESHGTPGRIQVTQPVYEKLKDKYNLEFRGEIDIKGKGLMPTWWLNGRK